MEFTARQIADLLNGTIEGNPDISVHTLAKIEEGKKGALSFLANPKYASYIYNTKSSIVIVSNDFKGVKNIPATLIRVADPYSAFASLLEMYDRFSFNERGISEEAHIDSSAQIEAEVFIGAQTFIGKNVRVSQDVYIFPQVYIGDDVQIGEGSILYPGVKVMHHCVIGKRCRIHAGSVIGSDGFGFAPKDSKDYQKVPQIGNVVIEDDVEIGSNVSIDRATLGSTTIRQGVKIDNLVQIAHNVEIGDHSVIAAQAGISGSTKLGKHCMVGGQVGFAGHLNIADEVKIGAQAGLSGHVKTKGAIVHGTPAMPLRDFQRGSVYFRNFEKIVQRIQALEQALQSK